MADRILCPITMRDPADDRTRELDLGPFAVVVVKASGEAREFARYREPHEAAAVAARFRALGAEATASIVPADDPAKGEVAR